MFEIIFLVVLAAFAIGGIWAYVVSKKVKEEGIETDAVVSRIELHEWGGPHRRPATPSIWIRYIEKLQDGRGGKRKRHKIFWQAQ